jgi:transcriptional regulator with XRE-family HTH domain
LKVSILYLSISRCVAIRDDLEIVLKGQKPSKIPKVLNALGDHIRKRRLELGLLQREVAERLGVNESSVYNWEKNRSNPCIRFMPSIVDFLGYPPPSSSPKNLGETIKKYRIAHGLSQKRLAVQLRIDPLTVRRLECNRGKPTTRTINKLLEILE